MTLHVISESEFEGELGHIVPVAERQDEGKAGLAVAIVMAPSPGLPQLFEELADRFDADGWNRGAHFFFFHRARRRWGGLRFLRADVFFLQGKTQRKITQRNERASEKKIILA